MIYMLVDSLPPSSNHAYFNGPHGRVLSAEGKSYKLQTSTHIARGYPTELKQLIPNEAYNLVIVFEFLEDALLNAGYPKRTPNRYKKLDVDNRLKLLLDAITVATDLDDSHYWSITVMKLVSPVERTHIIIAKNDEDIYGEAAKRGIRLTQPN